MHAMTAPNVTQDTVLSLSLSEPACPLLNRMTVLESGRIYGQTNCSSSYDYQISPMDNGSADVDAFLAQHLPVDDFWDTLVNDNYYEIPSNMTSGTAANLYVRSAIDADRSQWLGIWNYGRGDVPLEIDGGMYQAVEDLIEFVQVDDGGDGGGGGSTSGSISGDVKEGGSTLLETSGSSSRIQYFSPTFWLFICWCRYLMA